ncbi:uncharacterized protein LOC144866263 [Branchiostoma floridae x Branchiostoma japonicum]
MATNSTDQKVGRDVEVYAGLKVGHACRQFGCFVRIEVDKTASGKSDEDPRLKSAFEEIPVNERSPQHRRRTWSLREDSMYTCGVSWIPDDHLRESCYVSRALSCAVPVEPYYYSARLKAPAALRSILPLVSWQCGEEETLPILWRRPSNSRRSIQCVRCANLQE